MKTFRNTLIVTVLTVCLTSAGAFAEKNSKITENNMVRTEITNLLLNSEIKEAGLVDVFFKLDDTRIKVISVESNNQQLNEQVKTLLESSRIHFKSQVGYYKVQINLNGGFTVDPQAAQRQLRNMLAESFNNSGIYEKGKATVLFKVNSDNSIKVVKVATGNESLASSIKNTINNANLTAPKGLSGYYNVDVTF